MKRFDSKWRLDANGCHTWIAHTNKGYGRFRFQGATRDAHRVAWYLHHGEWPEAGLDLDHLCRNRACVNIQHLELVTRSTNLERGAMSRRPDPSKCMAGTHDWVPENVYANGRCIPCKREYNQTRYYRAKLRRSSD